MHGDRESTRMNSGEQGVGERGYESVTFVTPRMCVALKAWRRCGPENECGQTRAGGAGRGRQQDDNRNEPVTSRVCIALRAWRRGEQECRGAGNKLAARGEQGERGNEPVTFMTSHVCIALRA